MVTARRSTGSRSRRWCGSLRSSSRWRPAGARSRPPCSTSVAGGRTPRATTWRGSSPRRVRRSPASGRARPRGSATRPRPWPHGSAASRPTRSSTARPRSPSRCGRAPRWIRVSTASGGRSACGRPPRASPSSACAPARVVALELVVQDGDDAPLEFRAARARLVLPELFLAAPAGDYFLLVGDPKASAPSYELTRVRDVVLAVTSAPVEAKASGPNPDYSRARLAIERRGDLVPQVLLWSVLVAAVVVLTALTLRLARTGGDTPPPPA